ncbi:hypothetical protein PVK06_001085 [Gossypium arboreum]|uniref:Uncharacterized protein n=1 Tax=Gossypium arboreum TaxID=29729 RepID=A0ABR0R113_GOSAR|nr:hypothetical protein PVK06_001085 [Gossypium arboreum]
MLFSRKKTSVHRDMDLPLHEAMHQWPKSRGFLPLLSDNFLQKEEQDSEEREYSDDEEVEAEEDEMDSQ